MTSLVEAQATELYVDFPCIALGGEAWLISGTSPKPSTDSTIDSNSIARQNISNTLDQFHSIGVDFESKYLLATWSESLTPSKYGLNHHQTNLERLYLFRKSYPQALPESLPAALTSNETGSLEMVQAGTEYKAKLKLDSHPG